MGVGSALFVVRKCVYVSIKKVRKDAEHTATRGHPGEEGRLEGRELYFICAAFFIKSVYYFYNPIFYLKKKKSFKAQLRPGVLVFPDPQP